MESVDETYYYVDNTGQEAGPEHFSGLRQLWIKKVINGSTLLWREGMVSWTAIDDLPTVKSKLRPPVPPPKPRVAAMPPLPPRRPDEAVGSQAGRGGASPVKGSAVTTGVTAAGGRLAKAEKAVPQPTAHAPVSKSLMAVRRVSLPKDGLWVEKKTADNVAYYFHPTTGAVSWDKPDSLKTGKELETESGQWVWVRDEAEGWLPSRVLEGGEGKELAVQTSRGKRLRVTMGPSQPLWPVLPSSLRMLEEDLVMLDDLNEAIMAHCLKERYHKDDIYTWVGATHSVLISVNPFKQLPIYTIPIMHHFSKPSPNRLLPPHTFALASNAYLQMRVEGRNQAVLISGESGAGKTEATKQCLTYLAETAGSDSAVEQRILNANPILESFGNSKTLRNNNSSRFGKWMEVSFNAHGGICGARMENYLLEKSRVVHQARGERNYHIFYQLFTSPHATEFGLTRPELFRYLRMSGCTQAAGIDDEQDHADMLDSLTELGFSSEEQRWMLALAAGILHMGNVTFVSDGDQGSVVAPEAKHSVGHAARLLRINRDTLATSLCTRSIEVRGELNRILQKPGEALEAADALSKAVYGRLFDWIVGRINRSMQGDHGLFIGILDIFGFEIFEKNSFEQLCINYCNEKLQQHFNKNTFLEEERVYREEGIAFEPVVFIDNQPVLDLIEKKPYGLLTLLDEEVRVPQGSDAKWLAKCDTQHAAHSAWDSGTGATRLHMEAAGFTVKHYAGSVRYDSTGFCEKNRDSLSRDLYGLMERSHDSLNQELFPVQDKGSAGARPRFVSLAGQFRKQLATLMETVDKTQPHYIRCIKPNNAKVANTFDSRMCIEQLTYAGVFEAVKIRKCGYPFRQTHGRFASRYRCISKLKGTTLPSTSGKGVELCRAVLASTGQDFSTVQIGKTMVLYRAEEHRLLELLRNLALELVMPVTQRAARMKIGRKYRTQLKRAKQIMASALSLGNDIDLLEDALHRAAACLGPFKALFDHEPYEVARGRVLHFKLSERRELTKELSRLVELDCEQYYMEFGSAIMRAEAIKDIPGTAAQMAIEGRCRAKLEACAAARIDPVAGDALWHLDRPRMLAIADEAAKVAYHSKDVDEIRAKLALPEQELVKLQLRRANELNDPERIINREVRLKDIYLTKFGHLFALEKCPMLQDPVEWACQKMLALKKDSLAAGFLSHTKTPIHAPLTRLPPLLAKEATRQFKQLMGYMGDRKGQYVDTYAQDLLATGLAEEQLRGELYVQVMKQLRGNESWSSREAGWALMALLLSCFPPPAPLENYLAVFLRQHAPLDRREQLLAHMYSLIYAGARRTPIAANEIPVIVADFYQRHISLRYTSDDIVRVRERLEATTPRRPRTPGTVDMGPEDEEDEEDDSPAPTQQQQQQQQHSALTANSAKALKTTTARGLPTPKKKAEEEDFVPPSPCALSRSGAPPVPPPAPAPVCTDVVVVCMYDYTAGGLEMLSFSAGERLSVIERPNNDWWLAVRGGTQGWVPAAYVQVQ